MLKTVSSITNAIGALNFKGTWNAATNTPTIVSGVGVKGDYFVVSVAGSTTIDGISNWGVGDWITYNGTVWQRVEGGADLNGVNLSVSGIATFSAGTNLLPAITTTGDPNTGIFFSAPDTVNITTNGVTRAQVNGSGDFAIDAGFGSAGKAYLCRAWVNFNGTGTPAIRDDGNVSSITDNGTGDYTVNFTTAMPDANYAVFGNTTRDTFAPGAAARFCTPHTLATGSVATPTFNVGAGGATTLEDLQFISVSVFR
jgi:hypothetical protein